MEPITLFKIQPSTTSSHDDFNFLEGKWKVHNRKLKTRLNNCTEWIEFESELHMRKTLNGFGNVENYYATFDGQAFEGMAIRLFDPQNYGLCIGSIRATLLWTNIPLPDHSIRDSGNCMRMAI